MVLRVVWYFEEGSMILFIIVVCRNILRNCNTGAASVISGITRTVSGVLIVFEVTGSWCGSLKMVVWYFEEDCVVL